MLSAGEIDLELCQGSWSYYWHGRCSGSQQWDVVSPTPPIPYYTGVWYAESLHSDLFNDFQIAVQNLSSEPDEARCSTSIVFGSSSGLQRSSLTWDSEKGLDKHIE